MKKQLFLDFISKYALGGLIETVAWEVKNGKLTTRMISDYKNLIGEISYNNFDIQDFEGKKLGVFKTSKFVSMLNAIYKTICETSPNRAFRLEFKSNFETTEPTQ